ncbi:AMP-binding protein [Amycolatopsis sp. YIM 10]|uniref:AMP-binding protein n=1 Tax=Amycolatopsis sp. YIM 10 TaxID=2653857 RepID=UPI0012900A77|nr:AMP-binding protein [Amycolatopsis sp. YIM 10]QFU89624.1 Universal stress protein [Amycolatopsis sp. YIM 10]
MARSELIRPLPELLRVHAERRGDKLAYADDHREVRYAELERRTARLAGHLAGLGVPRGARVVILLGNRVENVESYLTAIRAAAVGVPVNPRSSDAELAHILRDSGATVVITDLAHWAQVRTALAGREDVVVLLVGTSEIPPGPGPVPRVYEELATADAPEPPRDDLGLDDVAWMLYTSGTTGLPKGVLSTQRSCLWSVSACYVPLLGLSQDDHVLWPLPLFHSFAHVVCVHGVIATGASVRIVDGLAADDVPVSLPRDFREALLDQGSEALAAAGAAAGEAAPGIDVRPELRTGTAAEWLVRESSSTDLIVLGSRGLGGFSGLLVGSVAVALAHHGHCPVVVVRGRTEESGPVVVGVDNSANSDDAIGFAFEAASSRGVPLVAVHTWNDLVLEQAWPVMRMELDFDGIAEAEARALEGRLAAWREKYPHVEVSAQTYRARPADRLLEAAKTAQLLVVGSRGRGGFAGLCLGSTSQALIQHSPCPVAVIRTGDEGTKESSASA